MNQPLDHFNMLAKKVEEAIKAFDQSVKLTPNETDGANKTHRKRAGEEVDQNAKKQKQQ